MEKRHLTLHKFFKFDQSLLHTLKYSQKGSRLFFGGVLVLVTSLTILAYYLNHPYPEQYPDTISYLTFAQSMQLNGHFVDASRLPGYPFLIFIVFRFVGQGNVQAVSIVQAILFVLATLEIYILSLFIFRRIGVAFIIGLLVGTNITLLSYVKPLLSEGMALWLVVSLSLSVVLFVQTLRVRYLWLMTFFGLGLFLTRAEWIYLPVPLIAYLLLVAYRQGAMRRLLPHLAASLLLMYAILGGYVLLNAEQNHFLGITNIQNINAWGKVLQYGMQNEAPPQYAALARVTNNFQIAGGINPYDLFQKYPSLQSNNYSQVGAYSETIILHHPGEFLVKSIPVAFTSMHQFGPESVVDPEGHFGRTLLLLQLVYTTFYLWNIFIPLCALIWLVLLFRRRTSSGPVQSMNALMLISFYGLAMTTFGGYGDYTRFHTPFNPLLVVILWGSLLTGLLLLVPYCSRFLYQNLQIKAN